MPNPELPIASRRLELRDGTTCVPVSICLFAPTFSNGDWHCRFEIGWPEGARRGKAHGFDAVQAIDLTLRMIGTLLYTSEAHASGALFWETPGDGYGFPVPPNMRDVAVGGDRWFFEG